MNMMPSLFGSITKFFRVCGLHSSFIDNGRYGIML